MKSYYFRHNELNITLAVVYANSREEAENKLPEQHAWANASTDICTLIQISAGTEWDRELEDMDRIKAKYDS